MRLFVQLLFAATFAGVLQSAPLEDSSTPRSTPVGTTQQQGQSSSSAFPSSTTIKSAHSSRIVRDTQKSQQQNPAPQTQETQKPYVGVGRPSNTQAQATKPQPLVLPQLHNPSTQQGQANSGAQRPVRDTETKSHPRTQHGQDDNRRSTPAQSSGAQKSQAPSHPRTQHGQDDSHKRPVRDTQNQKPQLGLAQPQTQQGQKPQSGQNQQGQDNTHLHPSTLPAQQNGAQRPVRDTETPKPQLGLAQPQTQQGVYTQPQGQKPQLGLNQQGEDNTHLHPSTLPAQQNGAQRPVRDTETHKPQLGLAQPQTQQGVYTQHQGEKPQLGLNQQGQDNTHLHPSTLPAQNNGAQRPVRDTQDQKHPQLGLSQPQDQSNVQKPQLGLSQPQGQNPELGLSNQHQTHEAEGQVHTQQQLTGAQRPVRDTTQGQRPQLGLSQPQSTPATQQGQIHGNQQKPATLEAPNTSHIQRAARATGDQKDQLNSGSASGVHPHPHIPLQGQGVNINVQKPTALPQTQYGNRNSRQSTSGPNAHLSHVDAVPYPALVNPSSTVTPQSQRTTPSS